MFKKVKSIECELSWDATEQAKAEKRNGALASEDAVQRDYLSPISIVVAVVSAANTVFLKNLRMEFLKTQLQRQSQQFKLEKKHIRDLNS